jgi:hypothetical protein
MDRQEKDETRHLDSPKAEAYEAPKVLRVSLRPAEAVLGHCKVTGTMGPVSGSCGSGVVVCRVPGS